ncbi:MAG: 2-hydroxyacyl-CoA dehydratase [Deltaproteobacteria bacterium]|nr:MAG: 2-hydroxyacyl-CoA dehydratase [Deltaproteobacteria bacterium]
MRPESMSLFDRLSEKSQLEIETAKEVGTKVVGLYCTFAPKELVRAVGAIPVGLCGKDQTPIRDAETILPANLCPLIKSSYGYAITNTCPYFYLSDFLIGETTCDGKKKMFELLGQLKPLFLMHLPPCCDENRSLNYWVGEVIRLKDFLERQTGTKIGEEELSRQIKIHNKKRVLLKEIVGYCANYPVPISGTDMMVVMESRNFLVDIEGYINNLQRLARELQAIKREGRSVCSPDAPRILLTGCPVGKGSEKVLRIIEECGGVVVCQEHCTGIKSFNLLVDEDDAPYKAIAHRYLKTPCSCMTPNQGRIELLCQLIEDFKIQGVVDLTWQCCHTYNVESYLIKTFLEKRYQIPLLHLETDYSESDTGQLKTRIEALLEMFH